METTQKIMTEEERQAHIAHFLKRWKEEKHQTEEEARQRFQSSEGQAILKELRRKNAERGIIISEL